MKEARFYHRENDGSVRCLLCPKECRVAPGRKGFCGARGNVDGTLYAELYELVSAVHLDPIEKKPLYHFFPGTDILSLGTVRCNLACKFCQNWELVTGRSSLQRLPTTEAVRLAKESGSVGIAYTYNEPIIWYEYVLDTAKLARAEGLKNVLVTNGVINPEPLAELLPAVDAMNIDLKSIREEFYREYSQGTLAPVKETIRRASQSCHVEVTNLIVTEANDSMKEIEDLVSFVASMKQDIPLHFSRYFPRYHMTNPATPADTLHKAYELAMKKLDHVYLGNLPTDTESDTYCPGCRNLLIKRRGYATQTVGLKGNKCKACGRGINIVLS